MTKTLIAFFSRADENYFGGAMRYVKVGNTEIVAGLMKELIEEESRAHREAQVPHAPRTEVDSFKIEMKDPYSPVYMTCIDQAKKDLRAGARCRWRWSHSWKHLISPVKQSCLFARMKGAVWGPASVTSKSTRRVQSLREVFLLPAVRPLTQREACSAGFPLTD